MESETQQRRSIIPTSEREFEDVKAGDLIRVKVGSHEPEWRIYEGLVDNGDGFMKLLDPISETNPRIISWRSGRQYLQFSEKGVRLVSMHSHTVMYTPETHPDIYPDKIKLFRRE